MTKDLTLISGPFKRTADENDADTRFFLNSNAFSVLAKSKNICIIEKKI